MRSFAGVSPSRAITAAIVIIASSLAAYAQTASSKATAAISTAVGCTVSSQTTIGDVLPQSCHDIFSGAAVDVTPDNFARIMKSTVKLSNSQSLFVTPSLVTGLYTSTKTKSSSGGGRQHQWRRAESISARYCTTATKT